jgi:hypothetical protein
MKAFVHLTAPAATLIGVILSAWGTYRLTLYYHAFRRRRMDFWSSIARVCYYLSRFQVSRVKKYISIVAQIGRNREENRIDSLVGLYLLFVGFIFQGIGAMCWMIDSLVDVMAHP